MPTCALTSSLRLGVTAYAGSDALDLNLAQFENDTLSPQARDGAWTFTGSGRRCSFRGPKSTPDVLFCYEIVSGGAFRAGAIRGRLLILR